MAATVDEIRNKLNLYYASNKMFKIGSNFNYYISRIFNFEPFSKRKTATELYDIFYKLCCNRKGQHNKKYLKEFFPYYVFYDTIFDLNGKIVFYMGKESVNNGYSRRYAFHILKDFYDKYSENINQVYERYGGTHQNMDYRATKTIHEDVDDIYFIFHKQYSFGSISEKKDFKRILMQSVEKKLFAKKAVHLQSGVLPF